MKRFVKIKLSIIFFIIIGSLSAQDCSEQLNAGQRAYYSGKFNDVVAYLTPCLYAYEKFDQIEAYELLVKANLMLNNDSVADKLVHKLLTLNPFFSPSTADIVSFQNLNKTYEIKTRWKYGFELGFNVQQYHVLQYHSYTGITHRRDDYEASAGLSMGLLFEKPVNKRWALSSRLLFQSHHYHYIEEQLGYVGLSVDEDLYVLSLPIQLKYSQPIEGFNAFLSAGISPTVLLNSNADLLVFGLDGNHSILNPNSSFVEGYRTSKQKRRLVANYIAGGGIEKSIGLYTIQLAVHYEFGLRNLIKSQERYSDRALYNRYGYIADDFKLDHWRFSLGITKSIVYPQKKG